MQTVTVTESKEKVQKDGKEMKDKEVEKLKINITLDNVINIPSSPTPVSSPSNSPPPQAPLATTLATTATATTAIAKSYKEVYDRDPIFIAVSGIIAAGKTTFVKNLSKLLGMRARYEPVKTNPYLPLFYKAIEEGKDTYSFTMQVFLLNKRFQQHQSIIWSKKSTIQDRSIYEDPIFGKMLHDDKLMSDLDFQTYRELFINMTNFLHRPDVIVFLDVDPEVALKRKEMRSRECEKGGVSLSYLKALQKGYEDWLKEIDNRIPVCRINYNQFIEVEKAAGIIQRFIDEHHIGKTLIKL